MDRRVRRTRLLIRSAFLELLREKPLTSLTVTELTRRADIDRRTFYLHYTCIEDILLDIEKETADALHQLLLSMKEFNINSFFQGLTNILEANIDFWRVISSDDTYHRFLGKCTASVKSLFHELFFPTSGLSEEDFDLYSEYVASGITGFYYHWLISDSQIPLNELTKKAELAVASGWNLITAGK